MNAGDNIQLQRLPESEKGGIKHIQQLTDDTKVCEGDRNLKITSSVRAYITYVKGTGTIYYPSCTQCLKKVV
jgi:hypothetical protein